MNAYTNSHPNKAQRTPALTVAPVTRAIRTALAISATLLALGGSGAAFAQTCVATSSTVETCEGIFTGTVPSTFFTPVADLTLVLGDSANSVPTSVTPAAGLMGIDANWGGNVGVTSYADITTVGATGLFAYGSTSATVNNSGSITTDVTAPGAKAMDISAYGGVSVVNGGDISASSTGAYDVTTVSAYSTHGYVFLDNQASGTITASAQDGNAIAMAASAAGSAFVYNEGAVAAHSVNGIAIGALVYNGSIAFVRNHGSIEATSDNGQAIGEAVSGAISYVYNYGTVAATSGHDQAIGIESYGSKASKVVNAGSITAAATDGAAIGVLAQSSGIGHATVTNSGSIQATSSYRAEGVVASSSNGYAVVHNSGVITATGDGTAGAMGIAAYSAYGSYVDSSNTVTATSDNGPVIGIAATTNFGGAGAGFGDASITNSGTIAATSTATAIVYNGSATGVTVQTIKGGARVYNSGSIAATATGYSNAVGVTAGSSFAGNAYVDNSGKIAARTGLARATGVEATSHYGNTTIVNSGDISSTSVSVVTNPFDLAHRDYATGIVASSSGAAGFVDGITNVTNSGGITADSTWMAQGIKVSAGDGVATVTNAATGNITVTGDQFAIGIGTGHDGSQLRYGAFWDNVTHEAVINNAGNVTVVATGNLPACNYFCGSAPGGGIGIGVDLNYGKDVTVTNSGHISVSVGGSSYFTSANGIQAITYLGDVKVDNSGSIATSITDSQFDWGINASTIEGTIAIDNTGSIAVSQIPGSSRSYMFGISALSGSNSQNSGSGGAISIVNAGDINMSSQAIAYQGNSGIMEGIYARTGGRVTAGTIGPGGGISILNSGDINMSGGTVCGIDARSNMINGDAVAITNSGDITLYGTTNALGMVARNYFASSTAMTINNSGSLTVTSAKGAGGIDASMAGSGATTITNSGDISVTGHAGGDTGIYASFNNYAPTAIGDATINNSGSISVHSDRTQVDNNGAPNGASGVFGKFLYSGVTVINSGSIAISAKWDYAGVAGQARSNGILTLNRSYTGRFAGTIGDSTVTNGPTGSITANAEFALGGGAATANGIYAAQHTGNYGGSGYVSDASGITITSAGAISATALIDATAYGSATANGIVASNKLAGFANVTNDGSVLATATNSGAIVATDPTSGMATATGISVFAPTATVALDAGGYVGAIATGAIGTATGLSVTGTTVTATGLAVSGTVTASNAGVINATFNGTGGKAYGATITSGGDLSFTNTGHILASNATSAVGVAFNSPTNVTLTNSGTITANSAAAGSVAVLSTGASNATLTNSGTITGAIQTGAGNDTLTNVSSGIWNAVGASDFGAGDDIVSNVGTINLNNTAISLGSDPAGNQFTNTGVITVLGSNTITMGTGTAVNPSPFTNNGTINFQNGAANNTLTINGNFAGNGQIDMDVSGLHGTSDLLQIIGNVVAGSVNTVNVRLLDDPTTAFSTIPLVQVTGTSAPGSFVLGQFIQPKGFLGLSESLLSTPHTVSLGLTVAATTPPPVMPPPVTPPPVTPPPVTPPPVTPPPVTISVAVSGLSELGTLAASAAPGVQSLMRSQIGTLEDRMGAVSQTVKGGFSLWTRAFADSGTVDPGHSAGNFGQNGNFGFDQSNSGAEVGLDFAISDEFKAGALFAKSQANQSLDGNPADSSKITGDSSGIYGTWIASNGFYVDASYRWMTFHDRLHAPTGYASIHGNANAFNLEAGKTWTLQNGLQIAPQFQYTLTKVDNINAQTGSLAGFQSTGDNASRARLGVMFSKNYTPASSHAVWMPYASLSVVQELDGKNSYSVNNAFFGETNTKGTSVLAETGVNVQFGKLAVFGGLNWQDGGALKSFFGGQVGLRYTF